MGDKLHKTKGIVLRTVKYGDTSVIVSVFTEAFGIQSYLVNGIRSVSRNGGSKAPLFQPAAMLDMVVYHNELKQLNRIREFKWGHIYRSILSDVPRNAVALYMIELLTKCLKQPESNVELYSFVEDIFLKLDESPGTITANLPLFFSLHLSHFFGFRIDDNFTTTCTFLDLQEGMFVKDQPHHPYFLEGPQAKITSQLLKVLQAEELEDIKLNHEFRRKLLLVFETFYALHIHDFGKMRTIPVLSEILR